jgi:predicted RNase H-like HicB family nuclease
MKYGEVEFSVVRGIGRQLWRWSVSLDATQSATSQAATKSEAVAEAERAIDRGLRHRPEAAVEAVLLRRCNAARAAID